VVPLPPATSEGERSTAPDLDAGTLIDSWMELFRPGQAGRGILSDRVVLHVPGSSQVAGRFDGAPRVLQWFDRLARLTQSSLVPFDVGVEAVDGDRVLLKQRIVAQRSDRSSYDHPDHVLLQMRSGRIEQAWWLPADSGAFDEFFGQRMLVPLGKALFGVGLLVLLFVSYLLLQHWRRPVGLAVRSDRPRQAAQLSWSGDVTWNLAAASAAEVWFSGVGTAPSGAQGSGVDLVLPVDAAACGPLAVTLRASCQQGVLRVGTPFHVSSATGLLVEDLVGPAKAASLAYVVDGQGAAGAVDLHLSAVAGTGLRLCLLTSPGPAGLAFDQNGQTATAAVAGPQTATCSEGLRVHVGPSGTGPPPTFNLRGVRSLALDVTSHHVTATDLEGDVTLTPGGQHVLSTATAMAASASSSGRLSSRLSLQDAGDQLAVISSSAQHVAAADEELVPVEWDRNAGFLGPLFGALVALLLAGPVSTSVGSLVRSARSRGWFRRPRGGPG
jgi:ketosteroid isomerase-like protein